ncbi:MAG TPA: hypothetical protein VE994_13935 [Terriglobales bacterium]|nr:hypothetical protein [Terriglobales bacterium]
MSCCTTASVAVTHVPEAPGVAIRIGGITIALHTDNAEFRALLQRRYGHFVVPPGPADFDFQLELSQPFAGARLNDDVRVWSNGGKWFFQRGDFYAEWDQQARHGRMMHLPNPYSVDAVLRIVHTLVLAQRGGFLLHAASAIRNGQAFLFSGISGAGKTTMARLAPPDATVLTDEISYISHERDSYIAHGTPFAGELATLGANEHAPIAAVYLLEKGSANRIDPVPTSDAIRALLRNTLFFAHDPAMVEQLFNAGCRFVERVPVRRLSFVPDALVWELIG